ncbi:MAG: hypothetical protein ACXVA9_10645 [Bdellovibrionales bacterium]
MNKTEPKEKKNLFIELAKRKAAAKASGNQFGILGKDLSARFSKTEGAQSYTWRGGRNGNGKP